ncbi:SDR family oxidoreductase [Plantactinospora sp. WMMB782]|uniref:SDR family oxidoreductase n=1 Tax=Plantactinospora sp. WMMB782 TaxID=3404121 RepID=UPI003B929E4F
MTTSPVLVTGGTGTLGRLVVPLLRASGRQVRVLSRRARPDGGGVEYLTGDLLKGEGMGPAVDGAETVLNLAGGPKGDDVATGHLVRAASRAGVRHLVHISVVGADSVPLGFLRTQLAAERAVAAGTVPWTVLRAAQFHDFVLNLVRTLTKLPVLPAPGGMRLQPVDARDVAARLVDLALAAPAGRVPDLVGPTVYGVAELSRSYLRATGSRRPVLPVRIPGRAGRAYRAGANLSLDGATVGKRTWEEFLAERLAQRR